MKFVKKEPHIDIRKTISDKKNAPADTVRAQLDIQGRLERQSLKVAGFRQNERLVIIEIAVQFDDLRNAVTDLREVTYIRNFYIWLVMSSLSNFQPTVLRCFV